MITLNKVSQVDPSLQHDSLFSQFCLLDLNCTNNFLLFSSPTICLSMYRAAPRSELLGGGTMLSFAISLAENWGQLATLQTMWKVIFIPTLMISLCLEVKPAAPMPISSIKKLAIIILKNPKGGTLLCQKNFVSDFNEIQNLKFFWP